MTARQRHRTNVQSTNAADYNRRAVFLLFVNCCISQMTGCHRVLTETLDQLIALLLAHCVNSDFGDVEQAANFYGKFLPGGTALRMEFMRWQLYCFGLTGPGSCQTTVSNCSIAHGQ